MKKITLLFLMAAFSFSLNAQNEKATSVVKGTYLGESVPFKSLPIAKPHVKDKDEPKIVKNNLRAPRKTNENALPLNGDTSVQKEMGGVATRALEMNFDGANQSESGFLPPDPTGAVGPNHYVHSVNSLVKMFDKSGNLVLGPVALGTFWPGNVNNGDPIILYDQLADRWFISQFKTSNNAILIAVSTTADPTGTYNVWEYPLDSFPDYPHYTVWHDAYYLTANKNGENTYALERDAMLAGDPNARIIGFTLPGIVRNFNTVFSPEPANLLGTSFDPNTPGYVVYLQDDGWDANDGITVDHLKIWELDLDWTTPANSTVSQPLILNTVPFESTFAPFGSGDVEQPGTTRKIDMIGGVVSYMVNYRPFTAHNSMIVTFNVDIDGNDLSGVRWFELRDDATNPFSIFQEGTYAPDDVNNPGMSRFMGSAAIDAQGNIGLAFNVAGPNTLPGIRYTGRFNGDPLGVMTVAETTIVDGIGVQTSSNRFGDYSHLTMDPDNFTFWHTAEYFAATNNWQTRIASFTLSGGFDNDLGVSNIIAPNDGVLSATETVEVTIRNFGALPQTGFNVELRVDGGLIATETFTGTIQPNDTADFTFVQTANLSTPGQTYSISANTALGTDQFTDNDEFTKSVVHLFSNDLGVTEITAPTSGEGLGSETVTVTIENFGALDQSNFDVSYTINGGTPVVETVAGPVTAGGTLSYSFTAQGDFSAFGDYTLSASTLSVGDQDASNDSASTNITNFSCVSEANSTAQTIGPNAGTVTESVITFTEDFMVDDVNVLINLNHTFAADLDMKLVGPNGTEVVLAEDLGGSGDDYIDTLFDDEAANPIDSGSPPFTGSFRPAGNLSDFDGLQSLGDWTLSITDDANQDGGTLNNWSLQLCGDTTLSVNDNEFAADLTIIHQGNNQYLVKLPSTTLTENLTMTVSNMLGQQLMKRNLENVSGQGYEYNLSMSNKASGIYVVRIGNNQAGSTKRIIVE